MKNVKKEKRGFTIHGREYWLSKDEIQKEFGCSAEDVNEIWEAGKRAKGKTSKATLPVKPPAKKPTAEEVSEVMRKLAENGIVEISSTLLRDKLNLDKESGRDQIRRIMRKLEKAGKVVITQKMKGKRKQYIYKLEEE